MYDTSITRKLASFACDLNFSDLSENHVKKIKTYLLDWIGSVYAGRNMPPIQMINNVIKRYTGNPESTSIPSGNKTNCLMAALINGASSHIVEMDDLHRESILHPAAAIMPACLAVGEREGVSGKELILAISVGYEIGIRVALAVGPSHYEYWHTTATCGTYGAAAGAGKLLNLGHDQFVWALGSAGTQAAGLWEFLQESAMSKQLHPGKAAMNGIISVLLAKEGFTGAERILDGEKGFFRATSKDYNENKCVSELGIIFHSENNSIKYYASCGHTHSAIDSAIKATQTKVICPDEVDSIKVHLYKAAIELLGNIKPTTTYLAKFNIPFCVATAIRYGHVNLDDFTKERLGDSDLKKLMEKIEIIHDPELSKKYPQKWPASVQIRLKDGTSCEAMNDIPKGDPGNTLSDTELISKFKSLTSGNLQESIAEEIVSRIMNMESISNVKDLLNIGRIVL